LEAAMTTLRNAFVFGLTLAMLAAVGCEKTDPSPEERALIEQAVSGYLNALAEAYSTLDTSALEGHASPNEIAAVRSLLKDLLQSTGDRIDAQLTGFDIETLTVFRGINATVRLIEVWDITRYGAADGVEKGRFESTVQRTLLQLRLIDGHWIVVGRSNLEQFTPVPQPERSPAENPI
jgi:hypothetical protein